MTFNFRNKTYRVDKWGIWRWNPVQGDSDNERLIFRWSKLWIFLMCVGLIALGIVLAYVKYRICMDVVGNFWFCILQK